MRLITLNIWGGHVHRPLLAFVKEQADVDVFCLQEVYHNGRQPICREDRLVYLDILADLHGLLPEHDAYFRPVVNGYYGIAMLVKKSVEVVAEGEVQIYDNPEYPGDGPAHQRILQWLECRADRTRYTIVNVHGLWNGRGKGDSPERIAQARRIRAFADSIATPKIICGDFNLRLDTDSVSIIAEQMRDLVREHNVLSTRTSFYPKPERHADYVFTSADVDVRQFSVLSDEVSDHAPLLLEFT
jgi:endonuclease/exonuclease/phosphatase family metal-dependent hydrolase